MLRFNQIRRLAYNIKQGKKFIPELDKLPEFEKGKRFEFMKEEYGPEYKTFDEKYDLHVPKSEYEGKKSLRERFLEQDNNKRAKKIMGLILLCVFISCNDAYGTMWKAYKKEISDEKQFREEIEQQKSLEKAQRKSS